MKKQNWLLTFFILCNFTLFAQFGEWEIRMVVMEWQGEMVGTGEINEVVITAAKPTAKEFKAAQKKLEKYDKIRWNVHKVYPYAVGLADLLKQVDKETAHMSDESAKKRYLDQKQKVLFDEYEDDIRRMTTQQGKVLLKLISRQTGENAYSLIKDTKNGATAVFWSGVGSLFGINLKAEFNSEEDGIIEDFARELDAGGYNIFWKESNYHFKSL